MPRQLKLHQIEVLVDDRERNPLTFPGVLTLYGGGAPQLSKVVVTRKRLPTGDYAIRGQEGLVLLERKEGIAEVWQNTCTDDQWRFRRMLNRMKQECRQPVLLYMGDPVEFTRPTDRVPDPQKALDRLVMLCAGYQMPLLMVRPGSTVASRAALGETVIRWLLATARAVQQAGSKPNVAAVPS